MAPLPMLMKTTMLLAPWLATQTYACPYAILSAAVAGANPRSGMKINAHMQMTDTRKAVQVAEPPTVVEELLLRNVPTKPAADFLLFKDDAWRSAKALTDPTATISDARLCSQLTEDGAREWEVESPITFKYKVREALDVLDPASDALIFGHISNAEDLARAKSRPLKRVVVVDENVHRLYGDRIEAYFEHHSAEMRLLVLPTDEEHKDMDMVLEIAAAIHDLGIDRRLDPVIAIGGGVCMDIVGFAASIYRRRTPYVRVPTTLMGYVDASVGAKSGVNFQGKKNKLGAYLPPVLTLLDRSFLATLDSRQLANGAAEIAKMALVKDPELFELLATYGSKLIEHKFQELPDDLGVDVPKRVLDSSIHTMLEELAPNLWEDSLVRLVDFGHVFSMELEMAMLFDEKLYHGEAVAIDMAFSAVLAQVRDQIDRPTLVSIIDMLRGLQLPVWHEKFDAAMCNEALYERVKFSQGQKIPLPVAAGMSRIFDDITQDQCIEALAVWRELCAD